MSTEATFDLADCLAKTNQFAADTDMEFRLTSLLFHRPSELNCAYGKFGRTTRKPRRSNPWITK